MFETLLPRLHDGPGRIKRMLERARSSKQGHDQPIGQVESQLERVNADLRTLERRFTAQLAELAAQVRRMQMVLADANSQAAEESPATELQKRDPHGDAAAGPGSPDSLPLSALEKQILSDIDRAIEQAKGRP